MRRMPCFRYRATVPCSRSGSEGLWIRLQPKGRDGSAALQSDHGVLDPVQAQAGRAEKTDHPGLARLGHHVHRGDAVGHGAHYVGIPDAVCCFENPVPEIGGVKGRSESDQRKTVHPRPGVFPHGDLAALRHADTAVDVEQIDGTRDASDRLFHGRVPGARPTCAGKPPADFSHRGYRVQGCGVPVIKHMKLFRNISYRLAGPVTLNKRPEPVKPVACPLRRDRGGRVRGTGARPYGSSAYRGSGKSRSATAF